MNIEFNELGGVLAEDKEQIERAKEADLITLPKVIKGTNCFNCRFIRNIKTALGFCSHPKVKQPVNERMCCIFWSNPGEYRQFKGRIENLKE